VRIDGHTDGKGNSVKQWLVEKEAIGRVKMTTQGFGAKRPVAPNAKPDGSDDPDGRRKNRRVEIVIQKG
jgi:outer membrane protein OmpA-like peptidoglycan-associated protein